MAATQKRGTASVAQGGGGGSDCHPTTTTTPAVPGQARQKGPPYRYVATGVVANARLSPLLPGDWVDATFGQSTGGPGEESTSNPGNENDPGVPDFLWENAPRHETRGIRDEVRVYSHLPNGINILDSKWVLGRLFAEAENDNGNDEKDPLLATCETHCFSGLDGYREFSRSVDLLPDSHSDTGDDNGNSDGNSDTDPGTRDQQLLQLRRHRELEEAIRTLPDIAGGLSARQPEAASVRRPPPATMNWWVVKDAGANGAGGVWVVGPSNAGSFGDPSSSPMLPSHRYVAQQYVWPPVLYAGKKCHVRVYATITCDGRAFVHRRAFLHVANDPFGPGERSSPTKGGGAAEGFDDCVHITNCCANSHDGTKFAGEILADFGETEYTTWRGDGRGGGDSDSDNDNNSGNHTIDQPVVPLADFFPSVKATVAAVVRKTFRLGLLDGGEKNRGFEYCGMDFMLSYREKEADENARGNHNSNSNPTLQPVAYLLEINSPPSQDTASSLPHAEHLHNEVLRDWMNGWVVPNIDATFPIRLGGWQPCGAGHASDPLAARTTDRNNSNNNNCNDRDDMIAPSKAAVLNKIRWALFERKIQKRESLSQRRREANAANGDDDRHHGNENENEKGTPQRNDDKRSAGFDDPSANRTIAIEFSKFARSQFPFFRYGMSCHRTQPPQLQPQHHAPTQSQQQQQQQQQQVFFENAGGAQVPGAVIDRVSASLMRRHRETIGSETKTAARETLRRLLVGGEERTKESSSSSSSSAVVLGLNATSLLRSLAGRYASSVLEPTDEVLVSTENHLANFDPWIAAAEAAGATVRLWAPLQRPEGDPPHGHGHGHAVSSKNLEDLVGPRTRIVALPHASNVLGAVRPIESICAMVKKRSGGRAHVVVDGVAVAPHEYVGFDEAPMGNVDWYVVSMHKLFGPHVGVLLGRKSQSVREFLEAVDGCSPGSSLREERIQAAIESGTSNIEGCAGVVGLGTYFKALSKWCRGHSPGPSDSACCDADETDGLVSVREAKLVYAFIRRAEASLLDLLLRRLSRCPLLRIIDGSSTVSGVATGGYGESVCRLPTVSFVHAAVPSRDIYAFCYQRGIVCRHGFFLCTKHLAGDLGFGNREDGVLRVSLAHYNTPGEVDALCDALEGMPRWFGAPPSTP